MFFALSLKSAMSLLPFPEPRMVFDFITTTSEQEKEKQLACQNAPRRPHIRLHRTNPQDMGDQHIVADRTTANQVRRLAQASSQQERPFSSGSHPRTREEVPNPAALGR